MVNKMANVRWEHYPHVVSNELARAWLVLESNLGLAANTLDAYGRALQDYLAFSADQNAPVITATKDHIAEYVRHLTVRLFYDYVIEEGLRSNNPVGRGRYTPGKNFGG